jgi:hypothetical protein
MLSLVALAKEPAPSRSQAFDASFSSRKACCAGS